MSSHRSLVAFTLLVQSAMGSVWCLGVAQLLTGSTVQPEWHLFVALLFVLAGLGFSTGHLGRPGVCFYALRNVRHSWLSREVAVNGVFAGVLAVTALTSYLSGSSSGCLVLVASVVGGLALYAMARAYRLRTVPSWNHAGTLLGFLGSALLLGGLQFTLVSSVLMAGFGTSNSITGLDFSRHIGLLAALAGLVFRVQAEGTNRPQMANSEAPFALSQPVLQSSGLVLWAVSLVLKGGIGLHWTFLSLAAAGLVAGEIIHRVLFYYGYHRVGL